MFADIRRIIKSISKTEWNAERFFSLILVPLWILTFYFFILSILFPVGVNKDFVTRSRNYTFWVTNILSIIFLLFLIIKKRKLSFARSSDKISPGNFILLLLPLTPAMQYILSNRQLLSTLESFYVFIVLTIFAALIIIIIPTQLKMIGSSKILMLMGLAVTYSIINMASLSWQFSWHEKGDFIIQFAVLIGVFYLSLLAFNFNSKKLLYTLCFCLLPLLNFLKQLESLTRLFH